MISSLIAASVVTLNLIAQTASDAEAAPSPWPGFSMMAIVIVVFYFIVIAPQRKEVKERDAMRADLKKGDEVVTIGGLFGTVTALDKSTVTLRVDTKVELRFERSSVGRIIKKVEAVEKTA